MSFKPGCAATLKKNDGFDQIIREVITAGGSTFSNPPANYFRIAASDQPCRDDGPALLRHRIAVRQCHNPPV